jgi:hypothetical protein
MNYPDPQQYNLTGAEKKRRLGSKNSAVNNDEMKQLAGEDVETWWCGVENSTHHLPSYYILKEEEDLTFLQLRYTYCFIFEDHYSPCYKRMNNHMSLLNCRLKDVI